MHFSVLTTEMTVSVSISIAFRNMRFIFFKNLKYYIQDRFLVRNEKLIIRSVFVFQLNQWPHPISSKFQYSIYSITFSVGNTQEWKKLFKPCAAQRLFLPVRLNTFHSNALHNTHQKTWKCWYCLSQNIKTNGLSNQIFNVAFFRPKHSNALKSFKAFNSWLWLAQLLQISGWWQQMSKKLLCSRDTIILSLS